MEASGWWSSRWYLSRSPCSTRTSSCCTCPPHWQWPTPRSPSSPSGPRRSPCWSGRFWPGRRSTSRTSFCSSAGQTGKRWHLCCRTTCKWPGASTLSGRRRTAGPSSGESRRSRRPRCARHKQANHSNPLYKNKPEGSCFTFQIGASHLTSPESATFKSPLFL